MTRSSCVHLACRTCGRNDGKSELEAFTPRLCLTRVPMATKSVFGLGTRRSPWLPAPWGSISFESSVTSSDVPAAGFTQHTGTAVPRAGFPFGRFGLLRLVWRNCTTDPEDRKVSLLGIATNLAVNHLAHRERRVRELRAHNHPNRKVVSGHARDRHETESRLARGAPATPSRFRP